MQFKGWINVVVCRCHSRALTLLGACFSSAAEGLYLTLRLVLHILHVCLGVDKPKYKMWMLDESAAA